MWSELYFRRVTDYSNENAQQADKRENSLLAIAGIHREDGVSIYVEVVVMEVRRGSWTLGVCWRWSQNSFTVDVVCKKKRSVLSMLLFRKALS